MRVPPLTRARFALHQHGWPAALGLACLLLVPLADWATRDTRAQAQALEQEHQARRERLRQQPDPAAEQAARIAALQSELPDAAAALEAVELIHRTARAHGVSLATGEYRLLSEGAGGALARYQITLPAGGSYPALRGWTAEVLNALPSVALDELSLSRDTVGDATLEARVRWSFYMRAR